jgi:tRNA nucleotidyltransferase (CCA-adding enzyme)
MKVYRVGGSVRDELLGRPIADRDYVVVGATPEELIAQGFRPVGREFPVFLHPETHEEYALARTERKLGRGHRGFIFHAAPDVTLEQDLARRDLTINAMARDADGVLVDPYGGSADLKRGILRHVGPAFVEDPLRVLRVARFAARLGFGVASETEALLHAIAASGELSTLAPERIWQELAKALMEPQPSRFFELLRRCGALGQLLPEVRAASRSLRALDAAAASGQELAVRYAVLAGNLDERTGRAGRPTRNLRLAGAVSKRLRAPAACAELAALAAGHRGQVDRAGKLAPAALLDLLLAVDALRRPARFDQLLAACAAYWTARTGRAGGDYPPAALLRDALAVVRRVNAASLASSVGRGELPRRLRALRLRALRDWRASRAQTGKAVRRSAPSRTPRRKAFLRARSRSR